jgi:anti-sigma regulatory factor (Ser/Thr protein kinase)
MTLQIELGRNVQAPSAARAAVLEGDPSLKLSSPLRNQLELLVSELVSNAVRHSRGPVEEPIVLTATVCEGIVRVAVIDAGEGFDPGARRRPAVTGGYGLFLVEQIASRWGVDGVGGTRVWFELPTGA